MEREKQSIPDSNNSMVMSSEEEEILLLKSISCSCSCSCSWDVVGGSRSLDDVVTCESSLSVSDDSEQSQPQPQQNPLVLRRPSSTTDSPPPPPCQITIDFSEKQEIKQIYVRSSARVFEIYYNYDNDLHYLSTVRCGLALPPHSGHSSTTSSSTDHDGWVDIKPPNPFDLFEATAHISDAHPVLSLTVRLLSIQTGDSVFVDELYVFADPVLSEEDHDHDHTDSPPIPMLNHQSSSTTALMSMLVPTLFQMSKSRFTHSDQQNPSATTAAYSNKVFQPDRATQDQAPLNTNPSQLHVPVPSPQTSSTSTHTGTQTSRIERTLDELVARVARMEHFCLRFEDNMLKPLSGMEARLERVELHLESLIKNVSLPKTPCYTRFSAPEFSSAESEPHPVCTDGDGCAGTRKSESTDEDYCPIECPTSPALDAPSSPSVFQSDHMPSPANASQLLPSLVVTAPDFSSVDDEEGNEVVVAVNNSGEQNSLKKPLSIDDALASALAGLLCSASTMSLDCSYVVEEGTDYTCTEGKKDNVFTGLVPSDAPLVSPTHADGIYEKTRSCCSDSVMTEQEIRATSDSFDKTTEAGDGDDHMLDGKCNTVQEIDSSVKAVISLAKGCPLKDSTLHDQDCSCEETNGNVERQSSVTCTKPLGCFDDRVGDASTSETGDNDLFGGIACQAAHDDPSRTVPSDYSNMPATIDVPVAGVVSSASSEVAIGIGDSSFGEGDTKGGSGVLQNFVQLPMLAKVDFEIPILDVKFSPHEVSSVVSPVEALLMDEPPQCQSEVCITAANNPSSSEGNDFITVDSEEPATSEIPNNPFFSSGNHDYGCMPMNSEVCNQYMHASLI